MLSLATSRPAAKRRLSIILNGRTISTHDHGILKISARRQHAHETYSSIIAVRPCSGPFFVEAKPQKKR